MSDRQRDRRSHDDRERRAPLPPSHGRERPRSDSRYDNDRSRHDDDRSRRQRDDRRSPPAQERDSRRSRHRSRSPVPRRSRSPPARRRSRSPVTRKSRSPPARERRRRVEEGRRSPAGSHRRSPPPPRARSPVPARERAKDEPHRAVRIELTPGSKPAESATPEPARHANKGHVAQEEDEQMEAQDDDDDDAAAMAALMGFGGFGTTKGHHVAGNNDIGTADVKKERVYRQYMNRRGGFNRPLDKMA